MRNGFLNYLSLHAQASFNSLGQLYRAPFATLFVCLVLGIALSLPAGLFVALKNATVLTQRLHQSTQITLYLKSSATEKNVNALSHVLLSEPQIQKIQIVSPREGLIELQQQADFKGVLQDLSENPLPWAVIVFPRDLKDQSFLDLAKRLSALPLVQNLQLDLTWVKRLNALLSFANRLLFLLAIFLSVGVFLIIYHIIRGVTQQNKREIEIIQLIGGTSAFIRRPFLYAGMIYGFFGSFFAIAIVQLFKFFIHPKLKMLSQLYNSDFVAFGLSSGNMLFLLAGGLLLGYLGAFFAVNRYL